MFIDGIGTVTADCKICKFRTDIVKGVHWQYVKRNSKKQDLIAYSKRGYKAGGNSKAYYCSKFKEWHSTTCCDLDCCLVDRTKLILYLQENMNRWKEKLEYATQCFPLNH